MQVSKDMAGFTGGQADTLRKAMGKKIAKLMAEMKIKFVDGSVGNGVEREIADQIFRQFEEFAAYGFNKSHAACYAMIAYQTAYLKAYWPECFMAALLNSDCTNLDRVMIEVEECRRMGQDVLPPDVNESFVKFSVVKASLKSTEYRVPSTASQNPEPSTQDAVPGTPGFMRPTIRFGLLAIKGLGEDVVTEIIAERKKNGPYQDLTDFIRRVPSKALNRKSMESLIRSGAMDRFGDRNRLLFNLESILQFRRDLDREAASGQSSLFTSVAAPAPAFQLKPAPPAPKREMLAWEKELLGLYVSEHPFKEYSAYLSSQLIPIADLQKHKKEKKVRVGGVLTAVKKIYTKNNEPMVFAVLEDTSASVEAVVFPRVYNDTAACLEADKMLVISGRPQEKDGDMKILVETAYELTPGNIKDVIQSGAASLGTPINGPLFPQNDLPITLHLRATLPDVALVRLRRIFDENPGEHPVYFLIDDVDGERRIKTSSQIAWKQEMVTAIEQILGKNSVKVEQTENA